MNDHEKLDLAVAVAAAVAAPSPVTWMTTGWMALRTLAPSNNQKATEAFREQVDAMLLDRAQEGHALAALRECVVNDEAWRGHPPHMRPAVEDLAAIIADFGRAYGKARSHGKRKMLFNAFFRSFDPKFYRDGMNRHLMALAEELEYPEARLLARRLREFKADRAQDLNARPIGLIQFASTEFTLARKLEVLELVKLREDRPGDMTWTIILFEVGEALIEFAWDAELESDDYEGWSGDSESWDWP